MPPNSPNQPANQKLDIKAEFAKLKQMYQEDATSNKLNVLLLGESGTGKTFLMGTAPGPVHIDSFDPGGSKGLRELEKTDHVLIDSRWEKEDPFKPTQFEAWKKETERRVKIGYFDHIGTYVLDSATTWSDAIMNWVLKKAGMAGKAPRFTHDYGPQKVEVINWIKFLLSFPCNVVITGHLKSEYNDAGSLIARRFMTTGQAAIVIPLQFDELWIMDPKSTSKGTEYRVLTSSTGINTARSRLSAGGKLDTYEAADLSAMMRKGGMLTE